jgi:hypothetical protein
VLIKRVTQLLETSSLAILNAKFCIIVLIGSR